MANIDQVQLPDGSNYNIVDNTSGFATQNYVDSAVSSVTKTTIGLGNVDNTSDLSKPISTATQAALDTLDEDKADKTDIATVESGTTASRAYSVGELVYVSGTLYRAKVPIASGATFTVGTNVEVTNVSDAIDEIVSAVDGLTHTKVTSTVNMGVSSYTFPSDGYVVIENAGNTSGASVIGIVTDSNDNVILPLRIKCNVGDETASIYVKKGFKFALYSALLSNVSSYARILG